MNNIDNFLFFINNKKKNFSESIDLNIKIINKNKKNFFFYLNYLYSVNEMNKILLISNKYSKNKNIYIGILYLKKFLNNEIYFEKIISSEKNKILLNNFKNFKILKKNIINNYDIYLNDYFSKKKKILINKNFINIQIARTNFNKEMIVKNYFFIINNIKKILFNNNIYIEKIYISTTMSKSFLIK
ncbi:putative ribosomal protein L1 [Candidatus Carsonella ruddii CS isolate Thao2000]|uniref:Putative ribosomal protein L1 n=1 Tax=Candidatus Carsonella ruddii CS isolate Thao2000 TaxID=1202537 RepID=J7GYZ9_CARRU|nr:hypothetical protein [Candidatus Carsonella ruddii]AFP83838.1 putative ribosomal protein L1 [Candidatus Carsonella ruddii CS isolate Thao2000]